MGFSALALKDFVGTCPDINDSIKYWFVRTEAGKFYHSFKSESIIGIGYPEITMRDIEKDLTVEGNSERLLTRIKSAYPESKRPGLIKSQFVRFKHEMKVGDFVIAPSRNTHFLLIGRITGENIEQQKVSIKRSDGQSETHFLKTRTVKWIKSISREVCNPNLYKVFNAHQAISRIEEESEWIDVLLFDFYKKNNEYHYVIDIRKKDRIGATELYGTFLDLLRILDDAGNSLGLNIEINDITTKINVNSPGQVKFIGKTATLGLLGMLIILAVGGEIEVSLLGNSVKLGTKSTIAEQIRMLVETYDNHKDRELIREKLKDLKVQPPTTVRKMLEKDKLAQVSVPTESVNESKTKK